MSIVFKNDKELLEFVSDEGVVRTHAQGYFWFWREFTPALERAKLSPVVSSEIIANCYYVAGDVHDFNDAPKAAMQCYRNALKADPTCSAAHREIANMLDKMGRYDEALTHCDKALQLDPDDQHARSDREFYVGEHRQEPPLYVEGDAKWIANEHLANANPLKALKSLYNATDISSLRIKTYCYGAAERPKDFLDVWTEIASSSEDIEFTYADWFFMEDPIWEGNKFWEVLLTSKAKLSGVFTFFDSLEKSDRYRSLSIHEKTRLKIEYYAYAHSQNKNQLKKLFDKYPEWIELRESLES